MSLLSLLRLLLKSFLSESSEMPGYSLSWFTVGKLATWDNTNNMAPSDKEVNRIKFDFFSSSVLFLDNKINKKFRIFCHFVSVSSLTSVVPSLHI